MAAAQSLLLRPHWSTLQLKTPSCYHPRHPSFACFRQRASIPVAVVRCSVTGNIDSGRRRDDIINKPMEFTVNAGTKQNPIEFVAKCIINALRALRKPAAAALILGFLLLMHGRNSALAAGSGGRMGGSFFSKSSSGGPGFGSCVRVLQSPKIRRRNSSSSYVSEEALGSSVSVPKNASCQCHSSVSGVRDGTPPGGVSGNSTSSGDVPEETLGSSVPVPKNEPSHSPVSAVCDGTPPGAVSGNSSSSGDVPEETLGSSVSVPKNAPCHSPDSGTPPVGVSDDSSPGNKSEEVAADNSYFCVVMFAIFFFALRSESSSVTTPIEETWVTTAFEETWVTTPFEKTRVTTPIEKTSVLKLQVGLLGSASSLQKDLNQIAETADTSSSKGLHYILTETVLVLLRHPDYCISTYSSVHVNRSMEGGENKFNQLCIEERAKFNEETLVNVNNIKKQRPMRPRASGSTNEYIVVTILAAARGEHELPSINNSKDLKEALQKLASIPLSGTLAVEVMWTPQNEDDTLSERELLEDYPLLRPL